MHNAYFLFLSLKCVLMSLLMRIVLSLNARCLVSILAIVPL